MSTPKRKRDDDEAPSSSSPEQNVELNEYEEKLRDSLIISGDISVHFRDIGDLDNVKDTLKQLVMDPLAHPELFCTDLTMPCKGVLLCGPPGTGKTMLAKAIATEAVGANFINFSLSSITSQFYGEEEKFVRALFTFARKVAPSVIFVDEADGFLSHRGSPKESERMRKLKHEFMLNWDGLLTKDNDGVLVLAATSRPFDLDEAVLRRLPRRLMLNLPNATNRIKILKVILTHRELAADVDLEVIADMTEGFSGSDLKNLCNAAAYGPIGDLLLREKREPAQAKGQPATGQLGTPEMRPLSMEDFRRACEQIRAVPTDSDKESQLTRWMETYGGRVVGKTTPTYYI